MCHNYSESRLAPGKEKKTITVKPLLKGQLLSGCPCQAAS